MLSAMVSILFFSYVTSFLFNRGLIPESWDVFEVKAQLKTQGPKSDTKDKSLDEQSENNEACEPMLESTC